MAGALCNVTQMAQQGTLVSFVNHRVQFEWFVITNGIQEVCNMFGFTATFATQLVDFLVALVKDGMRPVFLEFQTSLITIEGDKLVPMPVAAQSLPGDRPASLKFESHCMCVGSFLIILKMIATTARRHAHGIINV